MLVLCQKEKDTGKIVPKIDFSECSVDEHFRINRDRIYLDDQYQGELI